METIGRSTQLGLFSESQIEIISKLSVAGSCTLLFLCHSATQGTSLERVRLELRGDYVIQVDPKQNYIICGFKCDYSINFEIIRRTPTVQMSLGQPQSIQFIFTCQNKRSVKFMIQNINQLQQFAKKLQKKYVVQLGFHDSFKAIKILGRGLTATVYKASRFRDRQEVAIKSFKRSVYFATQNGKQSFQKEFKILSTINHKNVCGLESVYETQNTTYIVMENLALSLFSWIQKYGFPNFQQARKIMYQLLKGIEYLHLKGLMHRDLKLENIMVRKDVKQNIEIVIVDLGLAEYTNSQKFLYTRCGTPGYVAPQILKHKPDSSNYNQSCDIFSLGVVFHILFFKKPLFEGSEVKQVIKKNTQCSINFDAEYMNNFCISGMQLLKKMLQKDPSKRISALDAVNHEFIRPTGMSQININCKLTTTIESIKEIP